MSRNRLSFTPAIAKPCEESWAAMAGSARERYCELCDKTVHNFAAMTAAEIERLVARNEGKLCARITRRGDGSLVTLEARPKTPIAAQLVASASLMASAAGLAAQSASSPVTKKADAAEKLSQFPSDHKNTFVGEVVIVDGLEIEPDRQSLTAEIEGDAKEQAKVTGTVMKPEGALVTAKAKGAVVAEARPDTSGHFELMVEPGIYDIEIRSAHDRFAFRGVNVTEGELNLGTIAEVRTDVVVTSEAPVLMGTVEAVVGRRHSAWWFLFHHPIEYAKHLTRRSQG